MRASLKAAQARTVLFSLSREVTSTLEECKLETLRQDEIIFTIHLLESLVELHRLLEKLDDDGLAELFIVMERNRHLLKNSDHIFPAEPLEDEFKLNAFGGILPYPSKEFESGARPRNSSNDGNKKNRIVQFFSRLCMVRRNQQDRNHEKRTQKSQGLKRACFQRGFSSDTS
jgi:hypothetical protein